MRYEVKALGVGGILDQAVHIVKDRFGLLFGVMLVLHVPYSLISGFALQAATPELSVDFAVDEAMLAVAPGSGMYWQVLLGSTLIGLVIVMPLTNAASVYAIANAYLGKPVSVGSAYRRAFGVVLPLIGTAIVWCFVVVAGFLLLIIPGILFMFWFALWMYVVILEGKSGFSALSRSRALMKGNILQLIVLGFLAWFVQMGIMLGAGAVPQPYLAVVVSSIAQAGLFLFAAAAFVVFYFSCRCKLENFDLALLAESMGAEAAKDAEVLESDVFDDAYADSRE